MFATLRRMVLIASVAAPAWSIIQRAHASELGPTPYGQVSAGGAGAALYSA